MDPKRWLASGGASRSIELAAEWLTDISLCIRSDLLQTGAVLLRHLPITSPGDMAILRDVLIERPMWTGETVSARRDLGLAVVSPMRWPSDRMLCPYQEQSYSLVFPGMVMIGCVEPPGEGGEVLLSDAQELLAHLPTELLERFTTHGWRLLRTFREHFGLTWREAFGIDDVARLTGAAIGYRWGEDATLHTWRQRPAVIHHPVTGTPCWFNQAGFLNEGSMEPDERALLQLAFGVDLPATTTLGDGSLLPDADLRAIEKAYDETMIPLSWEPGDLLVLDNVRTACGRQPYVGEPSLLVTMGDPLSLLDCHPLPSQEPVRE